MSTKQKRPLRWTAPKPLSAADEAPSDPGVYEIFRGGTLAYTGKATNLKARLLQHRWCLGHLLARRALASYTYRVTPMRGSRDQLRQRVESARIQRAKSRGLLKHQRSTEIGESEAEAFLAPAARAAWAFWRRQLEIVARAFREQRYGFWCGPGNVCSTVADALDLCCQAHDKSYAAVGVTSGSSGGVSMWSVEGLKRTEAADSALVACAARNLNNPALGPAARAYARGILTIFGTRTQAARMARLLGL